MQRWGKTSVGHVRWRCPRCSSSTVVSRPDVTRQARYQLFISWITGTKTLGDIASRYAVDRWTITSWFRPFWNITPQPACPPESIDVLIIDGLYLESREHCALIGKTPATVIRWMFTQRETYGSWMLFFSQIPQPRIVVCDGQKGMRSALKTTWPQTRVQRCVFHIHELAMARITKSPRTTAGQYLRIIVSRLFAVRTRRQKRRWLRQYFQWRRQYGNFLKERTQLQMPGRKRSWWYTHRNLRSVRSLIDNALPELFVYIGHAEIPRTTNHVEGGINSHLSEIIHRHRGISEAKKEILIGHILAEKQRQKPTRNLT